MTRSSCSSGRSISLAATCQDVNMGILFFLLSGVVLGVLMNAGYELLRSIVARVRKRKARVYRRRGLSPMAKNGQIEAKIAQSRLTTESKSVEQRLAELDELCERGVISDSERAEARVRVLATG